MLLIETPAAVAARNAVVSKSTALTLAFSPAQRISDVVAISTSALPTGAWLQSFQLERGKVMTVRGTAKTEEMVAGYIRSLDTNTDAASGLKRFRAVDLTSANNSVVNQVPVTAFVVSAFPVGNLPFVVRSGGAVGR